MMTRLPNSRSIRGAALAAVAVLAAATWSLSAHAAPGDVQPPLPDGVAVAAAPAQRLRVVAPDNFPMEPSPRCEILNNFADGRSGGRRHEGIDILATEGQPVYAMVAGTLTLQVVAGSSQSGASLSGNLWKLTALSGGTYYVYAHLSGFAAGLVRGSTVVKGQLIGYVGDTGNPGAGNFHLHFEVHPAGGAAVDPLPLLRPVPPACKVF